MAYIDEKDIYKLFENGCGIERLHVVKIDELPRVDAVEVVRCKDCKYRNKDKTCRNSMGRGILVMNDIEFCSCGERKVSE